MSGFQRVRNIGDTPNTGTLETFDVAAAHATILAVGDVVDATGISTVGTGVPQADAAGTTGQILGVIDSIDPQYAGEALSDTGLPALTAGSIKVSVEPNALFTADVANGPLVVADSFLNLNQVVTAATKTGGLSSSNMTLNATGKATTVTFPWKIVKIVEDDAGVFGNRAIVKINSSALQPGTVGA